jgi:GNAT superfamily N-acetyltransferase
MEFARVAAEVNEEFDAWFGVLQRSEREREGGDGNGWHPDEWRARAVTTAGPTHHRLYSYGPGPRNPVAVAALEVTTSENLAWARGDLFVDPAQRRQGHGTQILAHVENAARRLQRSALVIFVMEGAHEVGLAPNRSFAPARGYQHAEENVRRDIAWPQSAAFRQALLDEWSPLATDYDIVSWVGRTPSELLIERAHLSAIMPSETPHLGIDYEVEVWDGGRVRFHEATTHEMGRDLLVSAARHRESGAMVGYSELTVSREQPETAYQWDTLVTTAHRGHRLGGLMKLRNLENLALGGYATTKVSTFNAVLNQPMINVNEALGGRTSGSMVAWRREL